MPVLIFLPVSDEAPFRLFNPDTRLWTEVADFTEQPNAFADQEVWGVLPGEGAITRKMALAMKGQRDVIRAAGYLLDDVAALSNEDLAVGFAALEDGQRLVTAMARGTVTEALARFQEAGLDPDLLTTDHCLLAAPNEGEAFVLAMDDLEWTRLPDAAFTAEEGFAEAVLSGDEAPSLKQLYTDDWVRHLDPEPPNFRVGPLVKRKPLPDFRPFRMAAAVLLAAGTLFLTASYVEAVRYKGAAEDLRRTAEQQYLEAFPGSPIVDLERQVLTRMSRATGDDTFLPLVASLGEVLEDQETMQLSRLRFDEEGELAAELSFESFTDLEAVQAALEERGVDAQEGDNVRGEGGSYVTQLYLRAL